MPPVAAVAALAAAAFSVGLVSATFAVGLVVTAAISYAASAIFAPEAPKPGPLETKDNTVTLRDPLATRKIIYGQARVGGTVVFIDTTDDNKYLHLVVAFACHEIESFDAVYFDENELTVTSNEVTAPSRFNGKAWVYEHLGEDSQVADTDLVNASSLWTTAHRMRGIAYLYVKLKHDQDAYQSGIPNITALISGKKVYDPRTGLTAWSDNSALCRADYLMDSRHGLGIPLGNIDSTVLTTAADTCDESVSLKAGGTESRYTCNGVVDTENSPKQIIEAMATSSGAPTVSMMGQWYVHAGEYRTPVLSFDEDDIVGPLEIQTRLRRSDLFNQVKGTYASPDNEWQPVDFPVVTSSTYIAEDGGEVIWKELSLPFTTTASMAQRLGLLKLNSARRQITVAAQFSLAALDVIPTDIIYLSVDRMGWTNKTFEVSGWRFETGEDMSLVIGMTLRETDSAVYSWSTADESAANAAPSTNLPNWSVVVAPSALGVSSIQVPTGSGADETFQAMLQWTAPSDEFVVNGGLIEIQYKNSADSAWLPSWYVTGDQTEALIPMLEAGESYDFRIRSFNYIASSSWLTVTGITILTSGGVATSEDWGEWVSSPTARSAGCGADFGEWVSSSSCSEDWGSMT